MTDDLTDKEKQEIQKALEQVATALANKTPPEKIVKRLVKGGLDQKDAEEIVHRVQRELEEYRHSPEGRQELAKKNLRHMIFGVLWIAGGLLFTAITYSAASPGGKYWVAWGAVVFGLYDFFKGLFGWLKYRD